MVQPTLTGLVGLLALLQPALAAPQRQIGASDDQTCIADGKLYYSGRRYFMKDATYVVNCASNGDGDVIITKKAESGAFAACTDVCTGVPGCLGFVYDGDKQGGICYLKGDIGKITPAADDVVTCTKDLNDPRGDDPESVDGSTSPSTYEEPITSTSESTASTLTFTAQGECQQAVAKYGEVYREGSGSDYALSCKTDHNGGDLDRAGSDSFLGCVKICDAKPDCIGYAYTPGNCYLKSVYSAGQAASGVDYAINIERNATAKAYQKPAKAAAAEGSCAYNKAKGIAVDGYTIECDTDHSGGDIGATTAKSFTDCSNICDKTELCIGYAWLGNNGPGTCYLKGLVTDRETDTDADYAYKKFPTVLIKTSSVVVAEPSTSTISVIQPTSTSTSYISPAWNFSESTVVVSSSTGTAWVPLTTETYTVMVPTGSSSSAPETTSTVPEMIPTYIVETSSIPLVIDTTSVWMSEPSSSSHKSSKHHSKSSKHHSKSSKHHSKSSKHHSHSKSETIVVSTTTEEWIPVVTEALSSTTEEWIPITTETSSSTTPDVVVVVTTKTVEPLMVEVPITTSTCGECSTKLIHHGYPKHTHHPKSTKSHKGKKTKSHKGKKHTKPAKSGTVVTFSASGTTTVSTVTNFISESYTIVTSTVAPPQSTSMVAVVPNNDGFCKAHHGKQAKRLRAEVIKGNKIFHDMWLTNPSRENPNAETGISFTKTVSEAASMFINEETGSLVSWEDKVDCGFYHVRLSRPSESAKFGSASFVPEIGTGPMVHGDDGLRWEYGHFGSWLICGNEAAPELRWRHGKYLDYPDGCAHVKLHLIDA